MSQSTTTIVQVGDLSWSTEDQNTIVSGMVSLNEGDTASTARLILADSRLELANTIPLPYRNARVPFEVWFGYAPSLQKVFTGYLSNIRASGLPGGLEISAVDKAKGLRRVPRARSLSATSAAALIQRLAADHGLRADLTQAPQLDEIRFANVLQHGESDWDTITRLAEAAGCRIYERNGTLYAKEVGATRQNHNQVVVELGRNVRNGFSFDIDELTRSTTPNVFDVSGDRLYEGSFDAEAVERLVQLERTGLTLRNEDFPSYSSQAIERAQKAHARAKEIFRGSIPLDRAYPDIDVDDVALLLGFGPRFSGVWNIRSVTHDLRNGTTELQIYNGGAT